MCIPFDFPSSFYSHRSLGSPHPPSAIPARCRPIAATHQSTRTVLHALDAEHRLLRASAAAIISTGNKNPGKSLSKTKSSHEFCGTSVRRRVDRKRDRKPIGHSLARRSTRPNGKCIVVLCRYGSNREPQNDHLTEN